MKSLAVGTQLKSPLCINWCAIQLRLRFIINAAYDVPGGKELRGFFLTLLLAFYEGAFEHSTLANVCHAL